MFCLFFLPNKFQSRQSGQGFSLLEIVIALGIFTLFVIGIYGGIQMIYKVVYQSRLHIVESGILNEQVEIIRNLSYFDVGILNGSPAGALARTVTTTRNGVVFTITRTIRNIDDPFDGTIGGNPNDTAPADYKLVQIDVICSGCGQKVLRTLTTRVGPKYLENNPSNGALFIKVFDAAAKPVPGASVHIVSTSTIPTIDLVDTTDNEGMLRLVDMPPGVSVYDITVTKTGYTSAATIHPTESMPNPIFQPASVIAQDVTETSFSIDLVSSMAVHTMNSACQTIPNATIHIEGTKLLATEPDILKIYDNFITDNSGAYLLSSYEWDEYTFNPVAYDIKGSIPIVPLNLLPGVDQPVNLILGVNTSNSLLLSVRDFITGQPISNALVRVTSTASYDQTKITGVGHIRQTDWSGGGGQVDMINESRYFEDDGALDVTGPPGDITLKKIGQNYLTNATLESSTFDLGVQANYINLLWEPLTQPSETGQQAVRWQLATSSTTNPGTWNYLGPDGTTTTYYIPTATAINAAHAGDRYVRYKLWLHSDVTTSTPTISDVILGYTNSCTPPGQVYFGSLSNTTYMVEVTAAGYQVYQSEVSAAGDTFFIVDLVAS